MSWLSVLLSLGMLVLTAGTPTQWKLEHSLGPADGMQTANSTMRTTQLFVTRMGRFPYQDDEVTLYQNQLKLFDFFFTPFPRIDPNLTKCSNNEVSGRTELTLVVSLYTMDLLNSLQRHINKQHDTCATEHCGISLLPLQSIRLIDKRLQTSDSTLNTEWQNSTTLREKVHFTIYTSNMSSCEYLKDSIISRCDLSNFEVQYSSQGEQTAAQILAVSTEHIMKTSMYHQIQSQFPCNGRDIVAMALNQYKKLLNETIEQVTMNVRAEEGFDSIPDPIEIARLLDRQLHYKQVQVAKVDDPLWESLYWTPELTRPDRLSKALNRLMKQDVTDSNKFRYDYSQADATIKENLKPHEQNNLEVLEKHISAPAESNTNRRSDEADVEVQAIDRFLAIASENAKLEIDVDICGQNSSREEQNDTLIHYKIEIDRFNGTSKGRKGGTIIILERKDAEKLVRYFSEYLKIQGDTIIPKPIETILVKVGLLKTSTKLFSGMIHVKTRMHLNVVPIRCPYEYGNHWFAAKYDHLLNVVNNLSITVERNEQRTNALMNRILAALFPAQTATTGWILNGVTVAGGHGQGNASHLLNRPRGLYVDGEDTLIVADSENHRLIEWKRGATSGRVVAGGNGKGNRSDQLNLPADVIIDRETDSLIICEAGNHRVTRWSRRSGTQTGETIIDQIDCFGLAMDDHGSLYVTDTGQDEVRRYPKGETKGIVVAGGNGQGAGRNQLNTPRYVCVDKEQAVYVSDTKNHRIIKWTKGAKEGTIVAGGEGAGKNLTQLSHPQGVLVDAAGTVYVADFVNDRIMRWYRGANQGSVVAGGNGRADGANQLYHPTGLSFDREGMLYVADYGNHRVQRFLFEKN